MSCNCGCSSMNLPCCCPTPVSGITTTTTLCPGGNPCDEMFSSDCIIYNGPSASCFNINTGSNVTQLLQILMAQLGPCSTTTTSSTTTTTTLGPGIFTVNVASGVTSGQIVSFGTTFYTLTSGTLPCAAGATKLGNITTALTNASLTTTVTTGAVAAKLLIIKNSVTIGTLNIATNQTNFAATITGLTWLTTDNVTVQLITQA